MGKEGVPFIHPTAEVEDGAVVGERTAVWRHAHIRSGATIGPDAVIGANVYVDAGVHIGGRTKVQNNVSVYRGVELEDEVFVGPSAVFTNDRTPRAVAPDWTVTPTRVRRGASIGANATIVCGVEIGEWSMVAAGAVVTRSTAAHQLVAGNPARHHGWVCRCGAVVSRAQTRPTDLRGTHCPHRYLDVTQVRLGEAEERAVLEVLRSGHLAQGPKVEELEHRFAKLHEVGHAIAAANGTVALLAALQALQLEPGFEVVTSPFTFIATVSAVVAAGGRVRFADVTEDFTVDPARVESLLSPHTAVLLPVHLYGLPADLPALSRLASRYRLHLVEDAAQAHGAAVDGRPVGSYGTGCFSLYATKNLTAGEGGLLTTDDDALAERLRLLRNHGMRTRYDYESLGFNYRLSDVHAAIVLPQLDRFDELAGLRRRNAALLSDGLAGIEGLTVPAVPEGRSHAWHQYTVRVGPHARLSRDALATRLRECGIGTRVFYPRPVHQYAWCREHPAVVPDETPVAARMATEVLSLPVHPGLSTVDIERIADAIRAVLGA